MSKPRVFVYEGQEYADPNPELTNEQVRDLLARTFPALAGGTVTVNDDESERTTVTFANRPQRKGADDELPENATKQAVLTAAIEWYEARIAFDLSNSVLPVEGNHLVAATMQLRTAVETHLAVQERSKVLV